jgi:hypothetical protein
VDLNANAFRIVSELTQENKRLKGNQAVGGHLGGKSRAARLSPERRKEISARANAARWKKAPMTQAAKTKALKTIEQEIKTNEKQIRDDISRSGKNIHVDSSVLLILAKNYKAIKELEKK